MVNLFEHLKIVMRFILSLNTTKASQSELPLNYQYPLSAAVYKIIERANDGYAEFLHSTGYKYHNKTFKFFTFSDIRTPFRIKGDRMIMNSNTAELTICFHIPDAAENFIRGLFMNQQIVIADSISKVSFTVQQVVAEKTPTLVADRIIVQPMSPVVMGRKNERGHYDYLSPEDVDFSRLIVLNLVDKCAAEMETGAVELAEIEKSIDIKPPFFSNAPRGRLLTIKAGTPAETRVRGYDKFRLEIRAPKRVIEMALNGGIGMNNAMGMGCVGIVD